MKELIFKLSGLDFIKIVPNYDIDIEYAFLCTEAKVYFGGLQELYIGEEIIAEIFRSFILRLKKAIKGELQLHEFLTQNLGFIYNECFDDRPESMMVEIPNSFNKHWVVYDYKMWSGSDDNLNYRVATWMYNDKEGNIVLQVTKTYPWFYIENGDIERPDFIYYDDFIKNYKPLLTYIIPHEVAILLLEQAEGWMNVFSENEKFCERPTYSLRKIRFRRPFFNKNKKR